MDLLPKTVFTLEKVEIIDGLNQDIEDKKSSSFRFRDGEGKPLYALYFWKIEDKIFINKRDILLMNEYFNDFSDEKSINPHINSFLSLIKKVEPITAMEFSHDSATITLYLSPEAIINHLHFSITVKESEFTIHKEILSNPALSIELAIYSLSFIDQSWLKSLAYYCNRNIDNNIGRRATATIFKPASLLSKTEAQLFGHISLLCMMKPFNLVGTTPESHAAGFLTKRIPAALAALGRTSKSILQGDDLSKYALNVSQSLTTLPNLRKYVYKFLTTNAHLPIVKHALLLLKGASLSSFIQINNFLSNPCTRAHALPEILHQAAAFNDFWSSIKSTKDWEYIFFFDPDKLTKTRNDFDKLAFCAIELLKEESDTYKNFINPAVPGNITLKNALAEKIILKDKVSQVDHDLFERVYKFKYIEPKVDDMGKTLLQQLQSLMINSGNN